jgi:lysophospholipase L1-like esterase
LSWNKKVKNGKSAYDIWLSKGNIGTEQDFLDSLKATGGTGSGYILPTASSTVLGGVKVGTGLNIDGTGKLTTSVTMQPLADQLSTVYLNPPRLIVETTTSGFTIKPLTGQTIEIHSTSSPAKSYPLPEISVANNSQIRVNPSTGEFLSTYSVYQNHLTLLVNKGNKLVGGMLFPYLQFDDKDDMPIIVPKSYNTFEFTGALSSIAFIGNECWFFQQTADDVHTATAGITRRDPNNNFAVLGSMTHNIGHMNTTDYNPSLDALIVGNGSKDYTLPMKGWIFTNVSSWKTKTSIDWNTIPKVELDFTSISESKCQLVWGEHNFGKHNVVYLITDDNTKFKRIILGKGTTNLGRGVFSAGKSSSEYNGSWKIEQEWKIQDGGGVNQDCTFYNGAIYSATNGRSTDRFMGMAAYKFELCVNGAVKKTGINIPIFNDDGTRKGLLGEGIDIYNGKLYLASEDAPSKLVWFDIEPNNTVVSGGSSATVADSSTNGNILVNGQEINVYNDSGKADVGHKHSIADITDFKGLASKRVIADNCMTYLGSNVDSLSGKTYSVKHTVKTKCYDIQLMFGNFHSADLGTGNDITVKASVVYNSEYYPVTFNGSNQIVLSSAAAIFSDPITIDLNIGDTVETRTYVTASSGASIPYRKSYSPSSQGIATGDLTMSGTITQTVGNIYAPVSIVGNILGTEQPAFILIGDSNMEGAGGGGDGGWGVKTVRSLYPYTNVAKAGQKLTDFLGVKKMSRSKIVPYGNIAITCYGTNDIGVAGMTLATLQANYIKIWNELVNRGVKKIYANTIFPRVDNTTKLPISTESLRVSFNEWLRTVPAPLTGIIEAADVVETARNSGIWKDVYYFDGLHTNDAGQNAIAASINMSIFTL